jgi:phosphoribosylformylglycinamidine synthase
LFHEGPSRVLISTTSPEAVQAVAARFGVEAAVIGKTVEGSLTIRNNGRLLADLQVDVLRGAWESALPTLLAN